jgi:chromosome segregation ATPase
MELEDTKRAGKGGELPGFGSFAEQGEANEMFAIFEDLRRQLEHNVSLNRTLSTELSNMRDNLHNSELRSHSQAGEIQRLSTEIATYCTKLDTTLAELDGQENKKREFLLEIHRLKQLSSKLSADIAVLRQENEALVGIKEAQQQKSAALAAELSQSLSDQQQRLMDVETRLKLRTSEIYRDKVTIDNLQHERDNLCKQIDSLQKSVTSFDTLKSYMKDVTGRVLNRTDSPEE